jgi:hypothetical protein
MGRIFEAVNARQHDEERGSADVIETWLCDKRS